MPSQSVLFSLLFLFYFAGSLTHARRHVIFGNGGGAQDDWLTVEIVEIHEKEEPKQGLHDSEGIYTNSLLRDKLSTFQGFNVPSSRGVRRNLICDTCLDISTFLEDVLTDPDTLEDVIDYVNGSLCKTLPGLQEDCINLVEEYVPQLVETLQTYAAPDKLCGETKICPSFVALLSNDARTCKICTNFTSEALSYMQSDKTETEILDALHLQCSKLGDFSSQCNLLIDAYAPLYIQKIDSVTPEQLCQKVGICSSLSKADPSHCATCEFAVFQLKAKLRNPAFQEKMLESLLDSCSKMSAYVDECKNLIAEYGPFILGNIDNYVDPEAICTQIHACDDKRKRNKDFLLQLPISHANVAHQ